MCAAKKAALESRLDEFMAKVQSLVATLSDESTVIDLQASDGAVVGLRNLGSKYGSEVLTDKACYVLCSIGAFPCNVGMLGRAGLMSPCAPDAESSEPTPLTFTTGEE